MIGKNNICKKTEVLRQKRPNGKCECRNWKDFSFLKNFETLLLRPFGEKKKNFFQRLIAAANKLVFSINNKPWNILQCCLYWWKSPKYDVAIKKSESVKSTEVSNLQFKFLKYNFVSNIEFRNLMETLWKKSFK